MKFCSNCGHGITFAIPEGDNRERFLCSNCGMIHYQNPRLVVGCIPQWQGQVLLCLRDIEPQRNKWTLPAGYLENGESVRDGARRETREETLAEVTQLEPFYMGDLVPVNQLYLMFRCELVRPEFGITAESKEVRLFHEEEIPWDNIAFTVIKETLKQYFADRAAGQFTFRNNVVSLPAKQRDCAPL